MNIFIISVPNEEERQRNMRIRNILEEFFCLRSNLSNDDIISALRPGLKSGVENNSFWSEIGSGFGKQSSTPPPRIPKSIPQGLTVHLCLFECCIMLLIVLLPSAIFNGRAVFII